jgi:hypothetical protein
MRGNQAVHHPVPDLVFTPPPALPGAPTNTGIMVIKRLRSVNAPVSTALQLTVREVTARKYEASTGSIHENSAMLIERSTSQENGVPLPMRVTVVNRTSRF